MLNSNISPHIPMVNFGPLTTEICLASLGHPNKFQRLSHLGSITACHSGSGSQPNFAALNRGRHLYSAGRPSRWALAHILVCLFFCLFVYASNISGTAEWICAKFTRKTCLAPCSDEFECQGQRSRSPGTKTEKASVSSPIDNAL